MLSCGREDVFFILQLLSEGHDVTDLSLLYSYCCGRCSNEFHYLILPVQPFTIRKRHATSTQLKHLHFTRIPHVRRKIQSDSYFSQRTVIKMQFPFIWFWNILLLVWQTIAVRWLTILLAKWLCSYFCCFFVGSINKTYLRLAQGNSSCALCENQTQYMRNWKSLLNIIVQQAPVAFL